MENHGVITVGNSLETAYFRLELVEHIAKIISLAGPDYKSIPKEDEEKLFQKHCQLFSKNIKNDSENENLRELVRERVLENFSSKWKL